MPGLKMIALSSAVLGCAAIGGARGFCFAEHPSGYHAVIRQTETDSQKIDREKSPYMLRTDGFSGVKSGLYVGTAGVYLSKKEAEARLREVKLEKSDAYVRALGSYTNVAGEAFPSGCKNCWSYGENGLVLRGEFLPGKGWLLSQKGGTLLLPSVGEPMESGLCADVVPGVGWLLSEENSGNEAFTKYSFKLLSFSSKIVDEKTFSFGDGPEYDEVRVVEGADGEPLILWMKNGSTHEEWGVSANKFVKKP